MALVELVMPKMGESVMEGTILNWLKNPGDRIQQDESVLEVATDKVDTEVPSPYSGILKEIRAQKGEVIQVGATIAILETDVNASLSQEIKTPVVEYAEPVAAQATVTQQTTAQPVHSVAEPAHTNGKSGGKFYSPLVLNIARQENISLSQLETIPGTGKDGRVTKHDIFDFVRSGVNNRLRRLQKKLPLRNLLLHHRKRLHLQKKNLPTFPNLPHRMAGM